VINIAQQKKMQNRKVKLREANEGAKGGGSEKEK
jgi:hypothetical protein